MQPIRHAAVGLCMATLTPVVPLIAQGAATPRDTAPSAVVQRALDAYKRKDLDATFADYDSVFSHETLGDSAAQRVTRAKWLARMKADSQVVRMMRMATVTSVHREVLGPWVFDVWTFRVDSGPNAGKTFKHFDFFEVRHGKIVREIEG